MIHFYLFLYKYILENIFKNCTLYTKDIYYINYYLIDLNNNKIILTGKKKEFRKRRKILKELRYYSQILKNDYIKKNDMNFNEIDYQNFFVKIEYKSTFPRRTFIIKFLPLLNGMCLIHEYIQLKLYTFDEDEINKKYNEKNIIYGYDANNKIFRNLSNSYFENEHNILKQIQIFIIESLFCNNNSIKYFFYLNKKSKIYFSDEILDIINEELYEYINNKNNKLFSYLTSNNHNYYSKKIINKILNVLYEEYIQINNKEKVIHKSSSTLPIYNKNSILSFKSIILGISSSSLQLNKNDSLLYLFNTIKLNKNINPNDITIDLNDDNGIKKEKEDRISNLIDRDSNIRFSDLLSEKTINPKKNIKNIYPFPKDSEDNMEYKQNGGNFILNKINNKIYNRIDNKIDNGLNNIKINNKNKKNNKENNNLGEQSIQKFLIDDMTQDEIKNKNYKNLFNDNENN